MKQITGDTVESIQCALQQHLTKVDDNGQCCQLMLGCVATLGLLSTLIPILQCSNSSVKPPE